MPNDSEKVKRILSQLIAKVEEILIEKPFFFVTEHDLSAYLYSQLIEMQELKLPFKMERNGIEHYCYRVHLEYPRYSIENKKLKGIGKYDIAILKQENIIEEPFPTDEFTKKPVWVGFEVKLHWDVGIKKVKTGFESEKNAFAKEVENVKRRPADYGVVFHMNIDKKKECSLEEIKNNVHEFKNQKEIKDSRVFVVYIESYNEKVKKPNAILV